jgi:hypothetical protein
MIGFGGRQAALFFSAEGAEDSLWTRRNSLARFARYSFRVLRVASAPSALKCDRDI